MKIVDDRDPKSCAWTNANGLKKNLTDVEVIITVDKQKYALQA